MRRGAALAVVVVAACGDNFAPKNPCLTGTGLDPDACLLPWPSSAFLVEDSSTRTGYRIALPPPLLPTNDHGVPVDPAAWNASDGFSPMTTLLAELPAVVDPSPLPTWHDPSPSLGADSPTVIVDVDTGERVAHFAEIESSPDVAPGTTELYIRPAARLAENHHYAVAIRDLRDLDGRLVQPPAPFRELRDKLPSALADRRGRYERDVFAPLTAAGVLRQSLVLAWDFRTASGETGWGDLVTMRDRAFAAAGPNGLGCTVASVTADPSDPVIAEQILGTFTVPNFLQAAPDGTITLARDGNGAPVARGTIEAPFLAIVPRSALAAAAPLWIYGHGLFSDDTELARDFGRDTASKGGAIAVATNYTGLTNCDQGTVAAAVLEMSTFPPIIARLRQGIIDELLLARTFAGACAARPELAGLQIGADRGYFGNSMGGTLGQVIAGLSPDISRVAIGVGGMDFTVMMPRTNRWPQLEMFFQIGYPKRLDRDLLLVMAQTTWDLAESSSFGTHVLGDPLPGSHPVNMLFQLGLYDCDTSNIASEIAARTIGLPELTPSAHVVPGLAQVAAPQPNGVVYYDLGAAPLPDGTLPPPVENGVHEGVRRDPRAQAQIVQFLRAGGQVVDTCGGACVPSP